MGGTTIMKYGKTKEEALEALRKGMLNGLGMVYPDGDAALIEIPDKTMELYRPIEVWKDNTPVNIKFEPIEKGDVWMAIAVAGAFKPKQPKGAKWFACAHMHT